MDDEALKEVAERIVAKMDQRLLPLVAALEDLAETNEILMERIEHLEWMLGLDDARECACPECSKPPMSN